MRKPLSNREAKELSRLRNKLPSDRMQAEDRRRILELTRKAKPFDAMPKQAKTR